jgi:hypothetical protein
MRSKYRFTAINSNFTLFFDAYLSGSELQKPHCLDSQVFIVAVPMVVSKNVCSIKIGRKKRYAAFLTVFMQDSEKMNTDVYRKRPRFGSAFFC